LLTSFSVGSICLDSLVDVSESIVESAHVLLLVFISIRQRRKSAMRILKKKRGMSRFRAILFGIRSRARGRRKGEETSGITNYWRLARSTGRAAVIVIGDSVRFVLFSALQLSFVYPAVLATRAIPFLRDKLRRLKRRSDEKAAERP